MKLVSVSDAGRGTTLAGRVRVADNPLTRLRGLLGSPEPEADEGLLIVPCRGVHMFMMPYPIDVVFLDPAGRVVRVCHRLAPGARSPYVRAARSALELRAGSAERAGIAEGDVLTMSALETAP